MTVSQERKNAWKTAAAARKDRIIGEGGRRLTLLLEREATEALDYLTKKNNSAPAITMVSKSLQREAKRQGMKEAVRSKSRFGRSSARS